MVLLFYRERIVIGLLLFCNVAIGIFPDSFENLNWKCKINYCSNRDAYCSADCCTCLCNHGLAYDHELDYCLAPLVTTKVTTTEAIKAPPTQRPPLPVIKTTPNDHKNATGISSNNKNGSGSSTGAIVGGVLGTIAIVALIIAVALFLLRKRKRRHGKETTAVEDGVKDKPTANGIYTVPCGEEGPEPSAPIYAYADLGPNLTAEDRTISTSSKRAMLPRASPDTRSKHLQPYDYANEARKPGLKPPLAPRPVSCGDARTKKPATEPPSPHTPRHVTLPRSNNIISDVNKSPTTRREAPKPPGKDEGIIDPFYHVLDDATPNSPMGSSEPADDLYELPASMANGVNETGNDDLYKELNYAHTGQMYQSLIQDKNELRI